MFIVFEGVDGVGKTTQINKLKTYLQTKLPETDVLTYAFPQLETRQFLKEMPLDSLSGPAKCVLFLGEKLRVSNTIRQQLDEGAIVLVDRWYYTTYAYASLADYPFISEIRRTIDKIVKPHFVYCINRPLEWSRVVLASRGESIREEELKQAKLRYWKMHCANPYYFRWFSNETADFDYTEAIQSFTDYALALREKKRLTEYGSVV